MPALLPPQAACDKVTQQQRILVVEDDQDIRSTCVELLQDEAYAVEAAADGKSALETLGMLPPSAIVLDLMLPVMDG